MLPYLEDDLPFLEYCVGHRARATLQPQIHQHALPFRNSYELIPTRCVSKQDHKYIQEEFQIHIIISLKKEKKRKKQNQSPMPINFARTWIAEKCDGVCRTAAVKNPKLQKCKSTIVQQNNLVRAGTAWYFRYVDYQPCVIMTMTLAVCITGGRFTIQPHIIVHQQKFQLINTEYYRAKEESVILMSLVV